MVVRDRVGWGGGAWRVLRAGQARFLFGWGTQGDALGFGISLRWGWGDEAGDDGEPAFCHLPSPTSAGLLIRLQAEYDTSKAVADQGSRIRREIRPAANLSVA